MSSASFGRLRSRISMIRSTIPESQELAAAWFPARKPFQKTLVRNKFLVFKCELLVSGRICAFGRSPRHLQWSIRDQKINNKSLGQTHVNLISSFPQCVLPTLKYHPWVHSLNIHIFTYVHLFFISHHHLCVTRQRTHPGGPSQAARDGRIYFAGVPGPAPPRSETTARSGRTWRAGGWGCHGRCANFAGKMCPWWLVDLVDFTCIKKYILYIYIVYVHMYLFKFIYIYTFALGENIWNYIVLTWDRWVSFWWNIWTPECPGWKLGSINELYVWTHLQPEPHLVLVENHFQGCKFWAIAIWSLDLWAWQRLNGCKFWKRGTENVASLGSQNFLSKYCCILPTVFGEVSWLRFVPSNLYKANIKTFSCRDAVATIFLVLTRVSGGGSVASSKATVSYEDPALPAT